MLPVAFTAVVIVTVSHAGRRSKEEKRLRGFGSRRRHCRWWPASTAWPLAGGGTCGGGTDGVVCGDGKKKQGREATQEVWFSPATLPMVAARAVCVRMGRRDACA